ncbi:hypothetical protein BKA60DRAFT_123846 [Fusarium oxysporum]|uniref:DUF3669 domain-containing protein n=1 Tax=Fusarium oxysporum TaxID=5507 RepID=A0A420NSM4_FUSOX|nr:hypothetical protein BKA60DRAFT_123846 [Fusarium oxysporum]RKK83247.1 hypothetical protein BFJ69_g2790 [Fusarium oxysporum]
MAGETDTPDNTMLLASMNRLPDVVTLITQVDNTTETQRRDPKYTLSTEWDCPPDKLASYDGGIYWYFWTLSSPTEYQLTKPPSHNDSNIHTVQVGCRQYAAKISNHFEAITKEVKNHISVVKKIRLAWDLATRDFYEVHEEAPSQRSTGSGRCHKNKGKHRPRRFDGPAQLCIPDFESEIIKHDHEGQDIATAGYVTSFIPPFHPVHVRALVDTFLDPSIRESVKNDPNLSNVRLRVHLGIMSPPKDPTSARLLSRPVYLDQLMREAEESLEIWCEQMGIALAILHWECRLDAAGVKFYLAPDKRNRMKLWMTNFGDCKPLQSGQDETKAMAKAVYDNSVWPRSPITRNKAVGEQYWLAMCAYESFTLAYAMASEKILAQNSTEYVKGYPTRFIRKLTFISPGTSPVMNEIQDKLKRISLKFWRRRKAT